METESVYGITYGDIRPVKALSAPKVGGFPVYPDLVDDLCGWTTGSPPEQVTHVCAVLSAWAYSDAHTLSQMMVRMGLERNRCRRICIVNDSMFVRSTAFLMQSYCGRIAFLVYRGTEPFELATWATDADVN